MLTTSGAKPRAPASVRFRALSLSTGIFYMPKGFDAKDFGALPGTFHTDKELLATAAISWIFRVSKLTNVGAGLQARFSRRI